jgi:hypothetical protein
MVGDELLELGDQRRPFSTLELLRRPEINLLAVDERLQRTEQADFDRHTPLSTRRRPFVYPDLRYVGA